MTFHAAIFDLDGTLLDTESLVVAAGAAALTNFDRQDGHEVMLRLVGIGPVESQRILSDLLGSARLPAFYDAWNAASDRALASAIPLRPGVADLLAALNARALPQAVATNSSTAGARKKLVSAGLGAHFGEHVVGYDAVPAPKPAPDVYLAAAHRLGVAPEACVAFEDSDTGVAAALAAGMTVVHVPDMAPPGRDDAHHMAETILDGARACGLIR